MPESFDAPINATDERLLSCMCVFVLLQILGKHKGLLAMFAYVFLEIKVLHVVALEGELAREELLAVLDVALVELLTHFL